MKTFAGLEVCRFPCALTVVVWHYHHFFYTGVYGAPAPMTPDGMLPLFAVLRPLYESGDIAVQVSWTLSGFILF